MIQTTARFALREATGAVHERLHHVPAFASLAAGLLDRAAYVALLGRLYGFHAPMEAALAEALADRRKLGDWRRADLLRADLATFGMGDPILARLPMVVPPAGLSEAEALGCLYVIEGSTLGGRQLSRQLDTLLGAGEVAGRRFLQAGTEPGRLRWTAFCAELDAVGADSGSLLAMIAGANHTFARFELWFAEA